MTSTTALAATLGRLPEEAERRGVKILHEPIANEVFALSGSDPTRLYRLTHWSCTCRGFMRWQRCGHWALFLSELGWLPEIDPDPDPEPDPMPAAAAQGAPALVPCPDCDGRGRVVMYFGPEDESGEVECGTYGGAGEVEPEVRNRASQEPDPWQEAPYDHGHHPTPTRKPRGRFGLAEEELVVLRGEAARLHAERGWPLVDFKTGEVLDLTEMATLATRGGRITRPHLVISPVVPCFCFGWGAGIRTPTT